MGSWGLTGLPRSESEHPGDSRAYQSVATRSELQHPRKLTQTEGSSSHHLWEEREQSRGWGAICGRKPDPRPAWRSAAQGTSERKKGVHAKGLRAPTVHPKKTGFDAVARPCSRGGGGASQHAGFVFAFAGFSMASAPPDFAGCRAIGGGLDPVLVLGGPSDVIGWFPKTLDSGWCCERPPTA